MADTDPNSVTSFIQSSTASLYNFNGRSEEGDQLFSFAYSSLLNDQTYKKGVSAFSGLDIEFPLPQPQTGGKWKRSALTAVF